MSEIQNKYLTLRYFKEIMTDGNLGTIYELLTPDFVFTLPTHPEPYVGPDGFKELVTMLHACFPDFYIHAKDMVASGDMVVTRWRGGGTHLGCSHPHRCRRYSPQWALLRNRRDELASL